MENTYRYSAAALGLFACGLMTVFAIRKKMKFAEDLVQQATRSGRQKKTSWPSIVPHIPDFDKAAKSLKLSEIEK